MVILIVAKLKLALIQMELAEADPPQNTEKAISFMDKASKEGADLIILPELWPIGFAPLHLNDVAEAPNGPSVNIVRDWTKDKGCFVLAGSIPELTPEGIYNKSYLFGPKGQVLGEYSKLHLFDLMGEKDTFVAGDKIMTANVKGFTVGVMICYDLRFPELAREYALNGVDLLLVPALWPDARIGHWDIILRARAIENQLFVAGCNGVGNMTDLYFPGQSMIVNPYGNSINEPDNRESLIIRDINSNEIKKVRDLVKYVDDRRDDVY
jgi:predicted amidohydrolase